jgi:hypothetical protein
MIESYENYLKLVNFTEQRFLDEIVNSHCVKFKYDEIKLRNSKIEGIGSFTSICYKEDEIIGEVIIDECKTELGRYVNHSEDANVYFEDNKFIALRDIKINEEILVNYFDNLITLINEI